MTPLEQWQFALASEDPTKYFIQVGKRVGLQTDAAGIQVSGREMATIGMFGAVGAGLGYAVGKRLKHPVIATSIGAAVGIGALFLIVNRSIPESNQGVIEQ